MLNGHLTKMESSLQLLATRGDREAVSEFMEVSTECKRLHVRLREVHAKVSSIFVETEAVAMELLVVTDRIRMYKYT
jgi:hypothetical protein